MCTGCHNAHQSDYPKILLKEIPGLCYNCHDESKFKGKFGHTIVGMCTGCHNPHSSNTNKILKSEQPDLCYTCHDKAKFTRKYTHAVVIMPGGCSSCHNPHIGNNPSLLLNPVFELCTSCHVAKADGRHIVSLPGRNIHPIKGIDPTTRKLVKVPDPKRPGKEIEVPDPNNPGKPMTCITCHEPHSSDFRKLFTAQRICGRCHKY
jgi:predicted CXXCH cytochrome family protein